MNESFFDLSALKKTDISLDVQLVGYGANVSSSDCNDCHYISSDCSAPCFC